MIRLNSCRGGSGERHRLAGRLSLRTVLRAVAMRALSSSCSATVVGGAMRTSDRSARGVVGTSNTTNEWSSVRAGKWQQKQPCAPRRACEFEKPGCSPPRARMRHCASKFGTLPNDRGADQARVPCRSSEQETPHSAVRSIAYVLSSLTLSSTVACFPQDCGDMSFVKRQTEPLWESLLYENYAAPLLHRLGDIVRLPHSPGNRVLGGRRVGRRRPADWRARIEHN